MAKNTRLRRHGRHLIIALAVVICVSTIGILGRDIGNEVKRLGSARSDNIQWTLSQVEVEFLELLGAVNQLPSSGELEAASIRLEFDVFYSRIQTIRRGQLFEDLRREERFAESLAQIWAFLHDITPIIDSTDSILLRKAPDIASDAIGIRPVVRNLANAGIGFFASLADEQRLAFSGALTRMAAIVACLIIALSGLIIYLVWLNAISRQKQREAQEANARINTIISTSLDGVIVANNDGRILEFNKAAEEIFGYEAKNVLGKNIGEVIVPDHFREDHEAGMKRMQERGEKRVVGHGRVQLEALRKNGDIFPVELAIQSAVTEAGELFIAFLRDISQMVAAEADLVAARDKALASEKTKSEFLAVMSHEIRTPLNGLLGNLTLLKDTKIRSDQQDFIDNMETSGRLLLSHVTDVLDITKYDSGKLENNLRPMRIDPFIQDLCDNQRGPAEKQGTKLDWRWIGTPVGAVNSDPDLLQPILLNLISNAVKFTKNGQVRIEIERVNGTDERPEVEFRVIDTGVGIEPDALERIFDDFVTGNVSLNRPSGGTGLGLGIAKRFAKALGGTLTGQSVVNEGSLFCFRVPFETVTEIAVIDRKKGRKTKRKMQILVVEDNEINRQVVREMLSSLGHTVSEAHDGQSGVDKVAVTKFDLIFMDISMPTMDGREATRQIRAGNGLSNRAPIIALTANVIEEDRTKFLEDGMNDVLSKPISRLALENILSDIAVQISPVEISQLAELKRTLGNDVYEKTRTKFFAEGESFLAQFGSLDEHSVAAEAHKLAGSAAMFGATDLSSLLKHLESAAKSHLSIEIERMEKELPAAWQRVKEEVSSAKT